MGVDQKQPACLIRPGLLNAGHRSFGFSSKVKIELNPCSSWHDGDAGTTHPPSGCRAHLLVSWLLCSVSEAEAQGLDWAAHQRGQ